MDHSDQAVTSQLRKGTLMYCLLGVLARTGKAYGFELAARLSKDSMLFVSEGTIYPLLSRLRREQLVESYWEESTSGPPRRYYKISASGSVSLEAFRRTWDRFSAEVTAMIAEGDEAGRNNS